MRFFLSLLIALPLLSSLSFADSSVPPEHKVHCRKWQNGECVDGALTDLAKSLRESGDLQATSAGACTQVCNEACPNCSKCSLCGFCDFYNSDSCKGVGYFVDPNTCQEEKTTSCCDLCDAHCGEVGACSADEYCKGGDRSTSVIVRCIEKKTGQTCGPCDRR